MLGEDLLCIVSFSIFLLYLIFDGLFVKIRLFSVVFY